jgi:hypothetical protein
MSALRLLGNSVYVVASLNACMDLAIVSGFTTYLPKYFETQFGFSKSAASVLTGTFCQSISHVIHPHALNLQEVSLSRVQSWA